MTKNAQGDFTRTGSGAANQMRMFGENLKELGATFGQNILPIINKVITKLNKLMQSFGKLSPHMQKVVIVIALIVAAIGPLLIIFGSMASGISSIISIVGMLGISFGAMLGWVALIVVAMAGLVAAGILLYKNWDTIKRKAREIWDGVKNTIKDSVNNVIKDINRLIEGLNKLPGVNIKPIKLLVKSSGTYGMADFKQMEYGRNAEGTNFWKGGWTWIGEKGAELVNLPRGTRVLSNSQSMALINKNLGVIKHEGTVYHVFQTDDRQLVARIAKTYEEDLKRIPTRVSKLPAMA
jgi:phage-related tail protein